MKIRMIMDILHENLYHHDEFVVTSDALNYFVRGRNSYWPPGIHSNYTTIPKYAAIVIQE